MGLLDWLFSPRIETLKKHHDIEGLTRVLRQGGNVEIRARAAQALGDIGAAAAVPDLIPLLLEYGAPVRLAATRALGEIGDDRAREPLAELLKSTDTNTLLAARRAVAKWMSDPAVAAGLVTAASTLLANRTSRAKKLWEGRRPLPDKCHLCSMTIEPGDGYVVTRDEMLDSDSCISFLARVDISFLSSMGTLQVPDSPAAQSALEQAGRVKVAENLRREADERVETPWGPASISAERLICKSCLGLFFT
jgi:hypothetical protein